MLVAGGAEIGIASAVWPIDRHLGTGRPMRLMAAAVVSTDAVHPAHSALTGVGPGCRAVAGRCPTPQGRLWRLAELLTSSRAGCPGCVISPHHARGPGACV